MKILWTKKAENNLSRILQHTIENFSFEKGQEVYRLIHEITNHLETFPELGRQVGGHFHKRYLIIEGNVLIYEIILQKEPMIVIRNIRPRKTKT